MSHVSILLLATLWVAPGVATGQSWSVDLQLDPAAVDRANSPCVAKMALPAEFSPRSAYVELAGKRIPAQLARVFPPPKDGPPTEVHFSVPVMKAGQPVQARLTVTQGDNPPPLFAWQDEANKFSELRLGEQKVLRYVFETLDDSTKERRDQTIKPFHHLYDPEGER